MQDGTTGKAPDPDPLARRVEARLEQERQLVMRLLAQEAQLPGSVFERWSSCNKPGCACAEGRRHGPYHVLALGSGTERAWVKLDAQSASEARRLVRQHREFRRGLRHLASVHGALLDLLRRHAERSAQRARRRMLAARPPSRRRR